MLRDGVPEVNVRYRVDKCKSGKWWELAWNNCDSFATAAGYVNMALDKVKEHGDQSLWHNHRFRIVKVTTIEEVVD